LLLGVSLNQAEAGDILWRLKKMLVGECKRFCQPFHSRQVKNNVGVLSQHQKKKCLSKNENI